jgi:UDP-N-acetyl-D-galactosamine dehydrogenase
VTVVGLGYVGLPLAVALARQFFVTGLDIDRRRIAELSEGHDRTGEIEAGQLSLSGLGVTSDPQVCPPSDFYIVTVPTPIDAANRPDLRLVEAASRTVGALLPAAVQEGRAPVVVFESTVYPGYRGHLRAIAGRGVGLVCGRDFFLGYSPERINPGDREHTIDRITKVVSGQTPEVLDRVGDLYGAITSGGVFRAASIKAAEAAKVIENAQRDINIAFMNEIAQIFSKMDISVWDVLEAARTKWNFPAVHARAGRRALHRRRPVLPLAPGRGSWGWTRGDPAGRGVNDTMAQWVAEELHEARRGCWQRAGAGADLQGKRARSAQFKVADLVHALAAGARGDGA